MEQLIAHTDFLRCLLDLMVQDILPADVQNRMKNLIENKGNFHSDELQCTYKTAVLSLIDDLSRTFTMPDIAKKRFQNEPANVKLCFYERYTLAVDILNEKTTERYSIPKELDGVFKWFFISLWPQ